MKKQQMKKDVNQKYGRKMKGSVWLIMIVNIWGLQQRNEENTEASDSEVVVF